MKNCSIKHVRYSIQDNVERKSASAKADSTSAKADDGAFVSYQPMLVLPKFLKKLYGYGVYHRERGSAF